jgi:hypothetical protein
MAATQKTAQPLQQPDFLKRKDLLGLAEGAAFFQQFGVDHIIRYFWHRFTP